MYRQLLALSFIVCCLHASGQEKGSAVKGTSAAIEYDHVGAPMPPLRLVTVDSPIRVYSTKDFDSKANLFVMMFNPLCGHCEDQAEHLVKNIGVFKRSKVIMMIDPQTQVYLPNFITAFHLKDHADVITVGVDSSGFIKNTFLYQALPQVNIYNSERRLIKTYTGGVLTDTLMQYIE